MKYIKLIAAMLIAAIAAVSLTGCMDAPDMNGTATITVYDQNTSYSGEINGWFADVIKDKFNIELNFKSANDMTFAAYMEQGSLGDIIIFSNENDFRTVCEAGQLLDWEYADCLTEYAPYINEHYADALLKSRSLSEDGQIYGINGNIALDTDNHEDFPYICYLRWDLYAGLGYPDVNTLEDFENIIADMTALARSNDSDSSIYGISLFNSWDDNMLAAAVSIAGMYGYTEWGPGLYNLSTDSYEACIDKDGIYIRALRFFNNLYRSGLLDPDSMSQTYELAKKDYEKGRAVFGIYSVVASDYNNLTHLSQDKSMMPITAADFTTTCTPKSSYGSNYVWAVSYKTKYPEQCMKFIDWMFSPEGMLTIMYGPKGLTWDYDDNALPYITDFGYECLSNTSTIMTDGYSGSYIEGFVDFGCPTLNKSTLIDGLDNVTYNYLTWQSTLDSQWYSDNYGSYDNAVSQWSRDTGYDNVNSYIEDTGCTIYPVTTFSLAAVPMDYTISENEIANDLCTYSWNAIYADSEEQFNEIIDNMCSAVASRKDYDAIIDFYTEQLDLYKASIN